MTKSVPTRTLREMVTAIGPKVVTAAHSAAAAAGVGAYAAGGNAFDAALAACFMEHVALPMKCGLFGDLVAVFRVAGGPFRSVVSIGPGPSALGDGATLEMVGPRSVGIPGAPGGYAELANLARIDIDRLVAPAVAASRHGVAWSSLARSYVVDAADLLARLSPHNPYMADGKIPEVGEIRRLPVLGDLLLAFAAERERMFAGPLGEEIVKELRQRGGILTVADLQANPATIRDLERGSLANGMSLSTTPSPTHGPRLIGVVQRALDSQEALPAIVRAERAESKRTGRLPTDGGTSVVTAADDEGNAIVVLHSNSFPRFASGIVLDSGLILNNRAGRSFDLEAPAGARNAPKAGQVPLTTLHGWCLDRQGTLTVGATPGGVNQLPWNAQSVSELARGADVADAVTSPRWALSQGDVLTAEEGAEIGGTSAEPLRTFSLRSSQQMIELGNHFHRAAADPRAGAVALAFY